MNKQIKNALDKLFKVIPYTPTPENELAIVDILQGLQNKPVLTIPDGIKHPHYYKDVSDIDVIDVYVVLHRFGVTDPCLQHLIKKALCTGNRGHKDFLHDLQDIADTAQRALEIHQPK